nr:MAG TPA: hypothetical protein [Caudoviricetes sp.]DAR86788.1 MAG TPA: hypothetical protein [Caudoviricetes sp.]
MFIAIKHSLRITTFYLCRVGGEYNTHKAVRFTSHYKFH